MNAMGDEVLAGIQKSIEIAETEGWRGLVIGNNGENFSAGANLALMLMLAIEQEYDELDFAVRMFQRTTMRARYSQIPVVVAPHGLTLGGSCELTMHADSAVANAETYIGLVEVGVGILPALEGGTKELALWASDAYYEGDIQIPRLQQSLMNIATAKVATSAHEAFDLGILLNNRDHVVVNPRRVIAQAKQKVLSLAIVPDSQPQPRTDIKVLGRSALGTFYWGIAALRFAGDASEHDELIAQKSCPRTMRRRPFYAHQRYRTIFA